MGDRFERCYSDWIVNVAHRPTDPDMGVGADAIDEMGDEDGEGLEGNFSVEEGEGMYW